MEQGQAVVAEPELRFAGGGAKGGAMSLLLRVAIEPVIRGLGRPICRGPL